MGLKTGSTGSLKTGNHSYESYTTTTSYVIRSFGFPARIVSLVNDSDTDPVQISWDGATLAYTLGGAEYKDLDAGGKSNIYVKATTGGADVRITAQ